MDGWERPDNAHAEAGWIVPVSPTLTSRHGNAIGLSEVDAVVVNQAEMVSENQRGEIVLTPYAHQITTGGGKPGQGYPTVLAAPFTFDWQASAGNDTSWRGKGRQWIIDHDDGPTRTLSSKTLAVAYPLAMRGRTDGTVAEVGEPDVYNSLRAGDGGSSRQNALITPDLAVRRLTPRECERLMNWPDDWTRWRADGTEIADSHRYRMCGNGVVSTQTEWIGHRILEIIREEPPTADHRSDAGA